jgi:hypothetical protein
MNPVRSPGSDVRGPKIETRNSKLGSPATIFELPISSSETRKLGDLFRVSIFEFRITLSDS